MTITNHIRLIEGYANQAIAHVDQRNYAAAHLALDDIATKIQLAHEHVDHLQDLERKKLIPSGGS